MEKIYLVILENEDREKLAMEAYKNIDDARVCLKEMYAESKRTVAKNQGVDESELVCAYNVSKFNIPKEFFYVDDCCGESLYGEIHELDLK